AFNVAKENGNIELKAICWKKKDMCAHMGHMRKADDMQRAVFRFEQGPTSRIFASAIC
ncbi:hypothetical protein HAX54_047975, partial [Datura stramonium]|nr:hypothetical protein [Datura stramonium]